MAKSPKQKVLSKKHLDRVTLERRQRRWVLIATVSTAVIVIGVVIFGLLDQFVFQPRRPVAKVGEEKISLQQFQEGVRFERNKILQQYMQTLQFKQYFGSDPNFSAQFDQSLREYEFKMSAAYADSLGAEVLDQMVDNLVIAQEARKMGISVSDKEIEAELQALFNFYPDGKPTPTLTATAFSTSTLSPEQLAIVTLTPTPTEAPTATLLPTEVSQPEATPMSEISATPEEDVSQPSPAPEATATPYTLEEYQKQLKSFEEELVKSSTSLEMFRVDIRNRLLREKVLNQITSDMKPEEEQVWARHILVAEESTANEVYAQIKNGADFAQLAAEKSLDTSNKDRGGDLGWFGKGKMVAEFETAAFGLAIGEISQPVKTEFGWHIIQVLGHEIRPISQTQFDNLRQKKFDEWLEKTRAQYSIEKFDHWKGKVPLEPALQQ
ncbi:MAG: hypothetical protein HPY45_08630 [Anaerolineae bacterium]|nr:hypothetical protein [Anaerolineae bacterium]